MPLSGQSGFHRLSVFGGDTVGGVPRGWPNGRRLGDDVVDIALSAVASGPTFSSITVVGDNVAANDQMYNLVFPYAGTPHAGPRHSKDSGVNAAPSGSDEEPQGSIIEGHLPEGIVFEASGDSVNLGATLEPTWLFLPDGRAKLLDADGIEHEQAILLVSDPASGRRRQVMMRALTGHSRIVPQQGQ